jgi:thiol-disulfide isomerase/thioredoxin
MRKYLAGGLTLGLLLLTSCVEDPPRSSTSATSSVRPRLGLEVGDLAPEVISQDLDGHVVRLSDLRGKVVVLDIWATWCGPCRAMIPHERDMVKRLRGQPFVLVSISADDDKQTLIDFLAKNNMPWTHWWNGPPPRGIITEYRVLGFPTTYVLDAEGIIRAKNVRGDDLEKAVNRVLSEMGTR